MTTATRAEPTSPSAEVRKRQESRDRSHARVKELQELVEDWDYEGLPPEFPRGGIQAEQHAAKREDEHGPNPHRAEYQSAFADYLAEDAELQTFKRNTALARIAEVVGEGDYGAAIREGFESVQRGIDAARLDMEEVKEIVRDTPGLTGQDWTADLRLGEWANYVQEALMRLADGPLARPGITELAVWKLTNE